MNLELPQTTYTDFPPVYFRELDKIEREESEKIHKQFVPMTDKLNSQKPQPPELHPNSLIWKLGKILFLSICVLTLILSIIGVGILVFLYGILFAFIISASFVGISFFSHWVVESNFKRKAAKFDKKIQQIIDKEEKQKSDIAKYIKQKKDEYIQKFESKASELSVSKFAGSPVIKEKDIVGWIMKGFENHVDNTNRKSSVQKIQTVYQFNVFTDKITCSRGTFDFNEERCSKLGSPIEQAALSKAIAAELLIKANMIYPKDKNDQDMKISLNYDYTQMNAQVNIEYTAINGNYQPVASW